MRKQTWLFTCIAIASFGISACQANLPLDPGGDFTLLARTSKAPRKPKATATPKPRPTRSPSPTPLPTVSPIPTASPTPLPSPSASPSGSMLSQTQAEILTLTNQERSRVGVAALRLQSQLNQAAQKHAEKMAVTGIFSHTIDNLGPADRVTAEGYRWSTVGENIAYGYTTSTAVMTGWMNSSGHKANILNANFTELGVGYALNSAGRPYWVQVFARPR